MNAKLKAGVLTFLVSLWAVAIFVSHYCQQRVPVPAPRELYSVVNSQLAAFRADDFSRAYRHETASVQQRFSLAQFEAVIRRDFAEITHADRVEFGVVRVDGATALVQVFFYSEDGSIRSFLYSLVAEDHTWKIDGVEQQGVAPPGHHLSGLHI